MMLYGRLVLVVGVLATLTTARDGLQTTAGELKAIRDNNGVAQCAISPPNMTVTARSKIDCMRVCLGHGCSCSYGANYHSDDGSCEFHSEPPISFQQVTNCTYYQVLISLLPLYITNSYTRPTHYEIALRIAICPSVSPLRV